MSVETITQAIGCERYGTKFMNSWGDELEDHIWHSLWGPNWAKTLRRYGTLFNKAKIFQQIVNKAIIHKQGSKDFLSNTHKFILYHLMEGTPFDLPQILFNFFVSKVMMDKCIEKDIYHSVVLTKVFEAHGVIRKFLYETPMDVQDKIYLDRCLYRSRKPSSKKKIWIWG